MNKIWIVVIAAVLVLLVAGGVVGHHMTTTDNFCSSCHAYEKTSWDLGMHPQAGCLDCHTGGFVRDKTQGARKIFLVFTGQVDPHHDTLSSYPDKTMNNCLRCHWTEEAGRQRPYYLSNHSQYMQAAENCIACHEGGHFKPMRDKRYLSVRRD
jgi:cytochrome c nitrite reductase small subunit